MSSVSAILQQMAENASRAQLQRGAILGSTIAQAANVPTQIMDDREHQRLLDAENARRNSQDARAAGQDKRQADADARDQAKALADAAHEKVVNAGLAAAIGPSGDPTNFDARAAFATVSQLGKPEAIRDVIARHREIAGKPVEFDPTKGAMNPDTGAVIRQPVASQKTQAELAADAANPNSPTQAQSATALDLMRPPKEPPKPSVGVIHDTPAGLVRIADDNTVTPLGVKGYHPPVADPNTGMPGPVDLEKLPAPVRAQAQALVDGTRALDPRLANKPYGQTIINAAYAIDPTFDTGNFNARAKARTDLTSPNGTGGKTIGALNTAIQHAGKLSDLIEKLDNSNIPMVNALVNPVKSATGNTAVSNFNTVAPQLAKEIERVWRGAGGTAGEIHDLIDTIGQNKGKQQQREALQQFVELAKGKLDALETQRDNVLGKTAGAKVPILFDQNKPILDTIQQRATGAAPAIQRPIPGIPDGVAESTDGGKTWKRVK
jgi:hypothetical protein